MTDNKAWKAAIGVCMAVMGEPYRVARRAMLGGLPGRGPDQPWDERIPGEKPWDERLPGRRPWDERLQGRDDERDRRERPPVPPPPRPLG